jgi:hypothetical protein
MAFMAWSPETFSKLKEMEGRQYESFDLEPRSDEIGMGLHLFVLTRFLHANRYPLRLKTL